MKKSGIRRSDKLRVTFCGYRSWAKDTIENIRIGGKIEIVDIIENDEMYRDIVLPYESGYVDCIIFIGWSWIIKDETLEKFLCVGIHPSDLPLYRGGSPIQHQIIAGLEETNISLMTISSKGIDTGDIWGKEKWDMSGSNMQIIFEHLVISATRLLNSFFERYPDIVPKVQNLEEGTYFKRRTPEESKVTWEQLSNMKLKDVYNLIRALTEPYPNIYIEDEEGNILLFKEVCYIEKNIVKKEY